MPKPANLMFDRRVVRGNTWAATKLIPHAAPEQTPPKDDLPKKKKSMPNPAKTSQSCAPEVCSVPTLLQIVALNSSSYHYGSCSWKIEARKTAKRGTIERPETPTAAEGRQHMTVQVRLAQTFIERDHIKQTL